MLRVRWLGRVEYREAHDLQRRLFNASQDDHLLLLEHQHVFTGGPNADMSNLLTNPATLGATYERTDRGGDITYHGPGQLTGYPVLSLPGRKGGGITETKAYIHQLEQVLLDALNDLGLKDCGRIDRYPGVWAAPASGKPRKIAAIGVRMSRGRTMHGFAVNVNTDLSWFDHIIPCGIKEFSVTNLLNEGVEASMSEVVEKVSAVAIETWGTQGFDIATTAFPQTTRGLEDFEGRRASSDPAKDEVPVLLRDRKTTRRRQRQLDDLGLGNGIAITERKPPWMKARIDLNSGYRRVRKTLETLELNTVCEEAGCPNIYECWGESTATFMINGSRCTRACGFCLVDTQQPEPINTEEPHHVAQAVEQMGLSHVVITAVARDDLDDGGASGFVKTLRSIRKRVPEVSVEILIPDFRGRVDALECVLAEQPDVVNHNLETVARLQRAVRSNAGYARSLTLLARAKERGLITKSGLMTGLGETDDELISALGDLACVGVDIVTIGQYLRPTTKHLPVQRWVNPETFQMLAERARELGFRHVEAGPLTRSSHKAARGLRSFTTTA